MDVIVAGIPAQGEIKMNETQETAVNSEAGTPSGKPTPAKSALVARQARRFARSRRKAAVKTTRATKASVSRKSAKSPKKVAAARQGTKTAKFLGLLKRSGGATGTDLMKATGWQAHSVRGFISGVLGKKMGLTVTSTRVEDGSRRYALKS